jgi:hypothetical protein
MEFYNDDSPATRFFTDQSIVLSGGREQDAVTREWTFTERIFYANYNFDDKSISLSIFDDEIRKYVLEPSYVKDYATAENLLRKIAAEYPKKVRVEDFLSKWKVFFTAMTDAVYVQSPITDTHNECGRCGDYNRDEFIFLYVPAVPGTALDEASLGVHWEYGCFGGIKISGTYEDEVEAVSELIQRMKESVMDDYAANVDEVLNVLEALTEAS